MATGDTVRWFSDMRLGDVATVGGKNASLGELYSALSQQGVQVPNGFALTAQAYRAALNGAGAWDRLHKLLDAIGTDHLREEITKSYRQLEREYGTNVAVAVRSSATAEDLPTASFAGQHESFLNVRGANDLFEGCRRCFASIFTDRAISYRINNGFDHFKVLLSVGVMKMVNSGPAASGVL